MGLLHWTKGCTPGVGCWLGEHIPRRITRCEATEKPLLLIALMFIYLNSMVLVCFTGAHMRRDDGAISQPEAIPGDRCVDRL